MKVARKKEGRKKGKETRGINYMERFRYSLESLNWF
jgi:hypothetical protein